MRGTINLGQAAVGGKLRLGEAQFFSDVKLYDASMKILELCSKRGEGRAGQALAIEDMLPFASPYATLASVELTLGWVLVPLLLAAFTGIIKRD